VASLDFNGEYNDTSACARFHGSKRGEKTTKNSVLYMYINIQNPITSYRPMAQDL